MKVNILEQQEENEEFEDAFLNKGIDPEFVKNK